MMSLALTGILDAASGWIAPGGRRLAVAAAAAMLGAAPAPAMQPAGSPLAPAGPALPAPTEDPLAIDLSRDPILAIGRESGPSGPFRTLVAAAVARSPAIGEAEAGGEEARAARSEAIARRYPSIDASVSGFRTIAREFSNDPQNIIERSRASRRTDVLVSVQQPVFDFGASGARVGAAAARLRAAARDVDDAADQVALRAIATWYDVFAYRALVALGNAFDAGQATLRDAVQRRIDEGVGARADAARVDSYVASARARLAGYRRQLAGAEARFEEMFGAAAPRGIDRAPVIGTAAMTKQAAEHAALAVAAVRSAEARAEAARQDARAVRADTLPIVSAGIDAGRYGVFETDRDYDVRGRVTIRQRLFGGIDSRADQAAARARAGDARAARIREEAVRSAAIAWSDVAALEEQKAALELSYVAGRRSRDVLTERFRVARGSLFDLLAAEDSYFGNAAAYIEAVTELDAARYTLLSRTGRLLGALDIAPSQIAEGQMSNDDLIAPRPPRFATWLSEPMLRNKGIYLKVALAAVMINLFALITSLFTMTVYDRVVPNNATSSLIALSIGLAIVILFDFLLRTLRAYFVDIAGARIDRDVGESVFARLLAIRLDLKRASIGALAGMMRELETLRDFFASASLTAIVDVPFILLTLGVIAMIGGPVVFVPMVMVPIVILAGWLTHPAMERLSGRMMGEGLLKQSVLVEAIGGIETVKAAGAGPLLARRWAAAIEHHSDSSLRQRLVGAISVNVATSANTISYAGVVIVGVERIAGQHMTMGALIACSILSGRAVAPLATIASLLARLTATRTAYRQIDALMQQAPEGPSGTPLALSRCDGRIEFRNVTFRYPGTPEPALRQVSFAVSPGERVALLGRVGSGKSTVARLLLGLYEPQEGLVMVDGTDIRQLDPATLRANIGSAMQESVLLTGSVRENITLGRAGIDDAEIVRAATISGTHEFIGRIANGYDLKLKDRGEGLSGGQRQSIAIARALAGNPPILLFDEPTSAMDTQTEGSLVDRLARELDKRTLILVTHRPSLLRFVTRVVVLDAGRIVADGPRDAVLKQLSPRAA